MIAQIVINLPTKQVHTEFSYRIPSHLSFLTTGWRVLVPFGSRKTEGFIVKIEEEEKFKGELKEIEDVLDQEVWFDQEMMNTARWLTQTYFCSMGEALRLFIPGRMGVKSTYTYFPSPNYQSKMPSGSAKVVWEEIVACKKLTLEVLKKKFGSHVVSILQNLKKQGYIQSFATTHKILKPKWEEQVNIAITPEEVANIIPSLTRCPAQLAALQTLLQAACLPVAIKEMKLKNHSRVALQALANKGIIRIEKVQVYRNSYAEFKEKKQTIKLNIDQECCLHSIREGFDQQIFSPFLLHGITGSGKTEVYLKAAEIARQQNKQVILLVPEIAATHQIALRFQQQFHDDVVIIHSKLSVSERMDGWERIRSGQAGILIGSRSALFAPAQHLGLLIIDEEHASAYKQEERPSYHARAVAYKRAKAKNAVLILGSATPSLESYQAALEKRIGLLQLPHRADGATLPQICSVDMREELAQGFRQVLSQDLRSLLAKTIQRNEQAILLLNRRGHSTFVLCRQCGYVVTCPRCGNTMVYHRTHNRMQCHHCHEVQSIPTLCPQCHSKYIKYLGTGTQKLEEELQTLFPQARIYRMDQDTTRRKNSSRDILHDFANHKADILVGTQMVAHGHDIKNVTAVGILSADMLLHLPDFRAAEKTFSLITQAAGRCGRGRHQGQVIVQTYNPEHYAIQSAIKHDYQGFYQQELAFRKELSYPPYRRLLKIIATCSSEEKAWNKMQKLSGDLQQLLHSIPGFSILGPFVISMPKGKEGFSCNLLLLFQDDPSTLNLLFQSKWIWESELYWEMDPIDFF